MNKSTREYVLKRDDYTCQMCRRKSAYETKIFHGLTIAMDFQLEIHHLDGRGSCLKENLQNNVHDNLITLCNICHFYLERIRYKNKKMNFCLACLKKI